MFERLKEILPWAGLLFAAGIVVHALASTIHEAYQWPRRAALFIMANLAGIFIFGVVYICGGLLVSTLGYTYNDKPLLRLAHLVCVIGAYPAAMAASSIFRTRHAAILLGILFAIAVHLWDHGTYLGRMVFDDPAQPLNGDFALTNMALIFVSAVLGGDAGLRVVLHPLYRRAAMEVTETGTADNVS